MVEGTGVFVGNAAGLNVSGGVAVLGRAGSGCRGAMARWPPDPPDPPWWLERSWYGRQEAG
eukprot:351703-Chlamydomonas_euryale.AAC.4